MSVIDDFDQRRLTDRKVKSRERAEHILSVMADKTARCRFPVDKRIDGWSVVRRSKSAALIVRDLKTGIVHARSAPGKPERLCQRFTPVQVGG